MSANEVIKEKERIRSHKQTLVLRCAAYDLSTTGKKPALAERLMAYLHPSEERPGTSQGIESDQSDTEERAADPFIATTSHILQSFRKGFNIGYSGLHSTKLIVGEYVS